MPAKKAATRTRKKVIEPEIMPDIDEQDESEQVEDEPMVTQRNIFDRKIPLSQALGMSDEDDEEYVEERRAEKKKKSLRQKIKERLQKGRNGAGEQLVMRVDRMTSFESDGELGVMADKVICFRMPVTLEYMEREDFIPEIMRRVPKGGDFTITTRDRIGVLDIIDIHIDKQQPAQPVTVTDPATGQSTIIYQQAPNGSTAQQPIGVVDPMKQFRDSLKMVKEMKEAFGSEVVTATATTQPPQPPGTIEERVGRILESQAVTEAIIKKVLGGGEGKSGKRDLMELVFEHAPSIIRELKEAAREIMADVRGNRNEQTQNQNQEQGRIAEGGNVHGAGVDIDNAPGRNTGEGNHESQTQAQIPIEEQIVIGLLEQCKRKVPPKVAYKRLTEIADRINYDAPNQSIDGYFDLFAEATPEMVMMWLENTVPGGKEVLAMPHSKQWIVDLQAEVKKGMEEG